MFVDRAGSREGTYDGTTVDYLLRARLMFSNRLRKGRYPNKTTQEAAHESIRVSKRGISFDSNVLAFSIIAKLTVATNMKIINYNTVVLFYLQ